MFATAFGADTLRCLDTPPGNGPGSGTQVMKQARACTKEKNWGRAEELFKRVVEAPAADATLEEKDQAALELAQVECKGKRGEPELFGEAEDLCSGIVVALRKRNVERLAELMSCSIGVAPSKPESKAVPSAPQRVAKALLSVLEGRNWIPDCTGQGVDVRFKAKGQGRLGLEFGYLRRKADGKKGWVFERVSTPEDLITKMTEALRSH